MRLLPSYDGGHTTTNGSPSSTGIATKYSPTLYVSENEGKDLVIR
jgi:hypothetical protein